MSNAAYTPAQLERIRELAKTSPDHIIGESVGFSPRKVAYIRKANDIPAFHKTHWTPERIEAVRQRYIEDGAPSSLVGAELGAAPSMVRCLAVRMGWKRDPLLAKRNQYTENTRRAEAFKAAPRAPKPSRETERPVTVPVDVTNAKPWTERVFGECAYPVSGEGADTLSCGGKAHRGAYCKGHKAIMYRKEYSYERRVINSARKIAA